MQALNQIRLAYFFEGLSLYSHVDELTHLRLGVEVRLLTCLEGELSEAKSSQPLGQGPSHPSFSVVLVILHFSCILFRHQQNKKYIILFFVEEFRCRLQIIFKITSIKYQNQGDFYPNQKILFLRINSFSWNNNNQNIIVMDRKQYTPTKQSKLFTQGSSYNPNQRQSFRPNGELAIMREYQALKLQARQLDIQNRQLNTEVDKLRYQKNLHENKLIQKATFEEEALNQFQKEKSYQIEMLKIKNQEDINRMRRQYEIKIEDLARQIRAREISNKQVADKNIYVESKAAELRNALQNLQMELLRFRDANSSLAQQLTRQQFANKKLEMLEEELQRQKNQMQTQIHILLDIQAEKSRDISNLQLQLHNSQNSQKSLHQKLSLLTQNFYTLEQHITVMKDRLNNADLQGEQIAKQLQNVQYLIADKQQLILEQQDRQVRLREEIQAHRERQNRRVAEIEHLMGDNQRAYRDVASIRHRLYDVSIEQGIDI